MQTWSNIFVLAATAGMTVGCGFDRGRSVLSPTDVTPSAAVTASSAQGVTQFAGAQTSTLLGAWTQTAMFGAQAISSLPSPNSCTEFQFTMTSQNAASAAGTFAAQCPGNLTLAGTVSGRLGGATIPMIFSGVATAPGAPACPFTLNGTGMPQSATELRIDYSGTTCLGPVTGTVTMRLAAPASATPPAPPAPVPAPAPTPTQPSASDPLLGCGSLVSGGDPFKVVECIHDRLNAPRTVAGAFEVTKRVAWAYRKEGAGLLIKVGGENIVSWKGHSFAAARVCLPDGHIFKVLTDVPTTNGPSLQDNGYVEPKLYVPAIDPSS